MTVKNIVFGEATEVNTNPGFDKDGLLGMAWPDIANQGITVVFQQMIDQGVVDEWILFEQVHTVELIAHE